ncbi:MAG: hypothetical protein QOF30_217 [Acidimicrobiaceae bacterium]|nr:hypothetical protein [Acidimicrobiaceae bacterium]
MAAMCRRPGATVLRRGAILSLFLGIVVATGVVTASPAGADLLPGAPQVVAGSANLTNVACMTGSECLGVGSWLDGTFYFPALVPITNGIAGAVQQYAGIPGGAGMAQINSIACSSTTQCWAVGASLPFQVGQPHLHPPQGEITPIINGVPQRTIDGRDLPPFYLIACASTTICYVDDGQLLTINLVGIQTTGVNQYITNMQSPGIGFRAISCASTTFCVLVGSDSTNGAFQPIVNGVLGSVHSVPGTTVLTSVSCESAISCLAVGSNNTANLAVTITQSSAGTSHPLGLGPSSVSCIGTSCEAAGTASGVGAAQAITSGTPGTIRTVAGTSGLSDVACPSTAYCVAVGATSTSPNQGVVVKLTPTTLALTCAVTSTQFPPAVAHATQTVTVHAAAGLASVNNIKIVNGTVNVPAFAVGTTSPVKVTATKTDPTKLTSWSFTITDVNGQTRNCT